MEQLKPLSDFFAAIEQDGRISITHIGIYAALLEYRAKMGNSNPIVAFSYDIMKIAKISSAMTYHKCVKDLNAYGYIRYEPSFNKNRGSKIYFPESDG